MDNSPIQVDEDEQIKYGILLRRFGRCVDMVDNLPATFVVVAETQPRSA